MDKIFRLVGEIALTGVPKVKEDLDEVAGKSEDTESKISGIFEKLGSSTMKMGEFVGKGIIAIGTAIGTLTTLSVNKYAEYEQLVGGVQTLFGKSADEVMKYANKAYQTVGVSANKYMEQVTSFSASLLQSLGGDTAKAADVANVAMVDMSDNANKMGTSMESIQYAYQGFAKQNYTMLDNLKLGYGGTQEEMKRLISDASKMTDVQKEMNTTVKDGDMSFGNIINAIHVMQGSLGIAGTTTEEASSTITGSLSAVKAAFDNLLVAMADNDQSVNKWADIMIENLTTFIDNMLPKAMIVFEKLPKLIIDTAPVIAESIVKLAPSLLASATKLFFALVQLIPTLAPSLLNEVRNLFMSITGIQSTEGTVILEKFNMMIMGLGQKIIDNVPLVISNILNLLLNMSSKILEYAPTLVGYGMNLILYLARGLMNALPEIISKVPTIVSNLANAFSNSASMIFIKGIQLIGELIRGLLNAIPTLVSNIPKIIKAMVDVFFAYQWFNLGKNVVNGIKNGFNAMKNNLVSTVKNTFNSVKNGITTPIQSAQNLIKGMISKIKGFFNFKVSLPKIKLPHFSIAPAGWAIGDLLKGKIPKLGIDWYAKAMDEPYLFTQPTIVGNKGFGEAGDEVVYGKNNLMKDIEVASNKNSDEMLYVLSQIRDYLSDDSRWYSIVLKALTNGEFAVVLDGREVGRLVRKYA